MNALLLSGVSYKKEVIRAYFFVNQFLTGETEERFVENLIFLIFQSTWKTTFST